MLITSIFIRATYGYRILKLKITVYLLN